MSDWLKCYVLCSKIEASTHANVRNVRFSIQNACFLAGACSGACYHLKEKTFFLFKTTTSTRTSTHQKTMPFTHQTSNYNISAGDCVCPAPFPKAFSDIARGPNWSAPGTQVQPVTSAISVVSSSIFRDRVIVPWAV